MICHVTFVIYNFVLYHIHICIICPIHHILICQRERRAETGGGCGGGGEALYHPTSSHPRQPGKQAAYFGREKPFRFQFWQVRYIPKPGKQTP